MTSDNDIQLRIVKDLTLGGIQIMLFETGSYHKPILVMNEYNWKRLNLEYKRK